MSRVCLLILLAALPARAQDTAFVFVGAPDPSGADEAFLRLGRARGATAVREVPGDLAEPPRARLQKAIDAYAKLQLPDARTRLDALVAEVAGTGGAGLDRAELTELFATRAALLFAENADAAAWDDLLQVAALAPATPLDPARHPPRVIETERRAAQALAAGGELVVTATPADSAIFVDGLVLGRGSVHAMLPAGRHFVHAERSGFAGAGRAIQLGAEGAHAELALAPRPPPPPDTFARQPRVKRVLGAWTGMRGPHATIEVELVDTPSGEVRGRLSLPIDAQLTDAALASALDALWPPPAPPPLHVAWYKRPLVWGIVGGVAAAAALGIGLGVGLSGGHQSGWSGQIDLRGAR